MEIEKALQDIGLSRKEISVYLALLELGESTASRVSEIAELNRITTYTLLKSLEEKGFCSIFIKNKKQYFKPISPDQILYLLNEKKEKIKLILPKLKEKVNQIQEKLEISLYEGKKGISSMLDVIIRDAKTDKEILAYGNLTIAENLIKFTSLHWRKTRLKEKIRLKGIVDKVPENIQTKKWQEFTKRKTNKSLKNLNTYVLITKNYVCYISFKGQLTGVLIKSRYIAEKEKFNFKMLWGKR